VFACIVRLTTTGEKMQAITSEEPGTKWEESLLLLQRESCNSGALLLHLASLEVERTPAARKAVWCMGRGGRPQGRRRFTWEYWTRKS